MNIKNQNLVDKIIELSKKFGSVDTEVVISNVSDTTVEARKGNIEFSNVSETQIIEAGGQDYLAEKKAVSDKVKNGEKLMGGDVSATDSSSESPVAGKRSKENLAQTLAAVDYKIDKTLKGSVPQPDDDWRTAVFKAAGKDDSISSDKTLGKALAGKFGKSVASIQVKEIADINTDNSIDVLDIVSLIQNIIN